MGELSSAEGQLGEQSGLPAGAGQFACGQLQRAWCEHHELLPWDPGLWSSEYGRTRQSEEVEKNIPLFVDEKPDAPRAATPDGRGRLTKA